MERQRNGTILLNGFYFMDKIMKYLTVRFWENMVLAVLLMITENRLSYIKIPQLFCR
jgi:hypothetical protein